MKTPSRLSLNKETLKQLDGIEAAEVQGAGLYGSSVLSVSPCCVPTRNCLTPGCPA